MKKNKKGFTLVELISVIVILSLIVSVSAIIFLNVRKSILKKDYNNLVTYLETKAAEYANETNITTVSVEDLIKEGVVSPDDQNKIYNPETKESMNCYIIVSTFENGRYSAKLSKNLGEENGVCNTYVKTSMFEICRYDETTQKCNSFSDGDWFNENITIGVKYANSDKSLDNASYSWSSTNGYTSSERFVEAKAEGSSVSQNTFKCEIIVGDYKGEVSKKVNIDKQAPIVNELVYDRNWSAKKDIVIKASDKGGSGINGFSLVKENETCTNYVFDDKFEVKQNGSYKYCVKDNAGNITSDIIKIDNIDNTVPGIPVITASDGKSQDLWHIADFTLRFSESDKNTSGKVTYYYGTSESSLVLIGNEAYINSDYSRETIYVKACNEAGACSSTNSYNVLYDNTPPYYVSGGSIGAGSISKPEYRDNDKGSGNVKVYTCVTSGSAPSRDDSCFTDLGNYTFASCGITYKLYSYAVDAAGNKSAVYDHATKGNATYYESCRNYDDDDDDDDKPPKPPKGNNSHESDCDKTCQMQKNGEKWHETDDPVEKKRLEEENKKLAKENEDCGSDECTFDPKTGTWHKPNGDQLYSVSGGKKNGSSSSSSRKK